MSLQNFPRAGGLTYDANGNPINPAKEDGNLATLTGRVDVTASGGGARTKLVDGSGNTINPAKEDGNLATIAATIARLDVALSTRASADNQTSGSARTKLVDAAGNEITASFVNSRRAVDIHIADTNLPVVGMAAVGAASSGNPVFVAGRDAGGNIRTFLLDATTGRLLAVLASEGATGAAVPTQATLIGGPDKGGNLRSPLVAPSLGYNSLHSIATPRRSYDVEDARSFVLTYTANVGSGEANFVYIYNNHASKILVIDRLHYMTTSTVNDVNFRVYLGTTVASPVTGTTITPTNCKPGSGIAAAMVYLGATLGGGAITRGNMVDFARCPASWISIDKTVEFHLDPGQRAVVTTQATGTNTSATFGMDMREV